MYKKNRDYYCIIDSEGVVTARFVRSVEEVGVMGDKYTRYVFSYTNDEGLAIEFSARTEQVFDSYELAMALMNTDVRIKRLFSHVSNLDYRLDKLCAKHRLVRGKSIFATIISIMALVVAII